MIHLSFEEFATRRRAAQERIEDVLRPIVREAADLTVDTGGWDPVFDAVMEQYQIAYSADAEGIAGPPHEGWREELQETLNQTKPPRDERTVENITVWLATWILSQATIKAAADDDADLFLEWVDMGDTKVRAAHHRANGQQRPIGEAFDVGGFKMPYPGWPGAPVELWINCRCTLRPVPAEEALVAAAFKDYTPEQRKKAHTLPDGSFPIEDCADLKNAIQSVGRAKQPGKAKAHIRSRKRALGCDEVDIPTDWSLFSEVEAWIEEHDERLAAEDDAPTHAGLAVYAKDTGRILMIQRSMDQDDEPDVQGTWEFPGGGIEGHETPQEAAEREFCEETGLAVPEGEITNGWRSENGVYQGFVLTVEVEADAFEELNPDLAAAERVNPDDPQRRNPDVSAWFTIEQIKNLGPALRPEVAKTDWSVFDQQEENQMPPETEEAAIKPPEDSDAPPKDECEKRDPETGECLDAPEGEQKPEGRPFADGQPIPWHGVLAPEDIPSGDGRMFSKGALRFRPLPLPLTWQKISDDGHKGNVTVARIDEIVRVDGEMRGAGVMLTNAEADEFVGLLSEFGRFGVSIDADDTSFEVDEENERVVFTDSRISSACAVPIPAFAEAWVALGAAPEGFMDGEDVEVDGPPVEDEALVASGAQFVDVAPGKTEDGPGWLTHPVDTDRLRDYWTHGEGAAKIGWGSPGDFNRCRVNLADHIKPQYLNGYCANRHFDALGFWPGRPVAGETHTFDEMPDEVKAKFAEPEAGAVSLTAAAVIRAPADWFAVPEADHAVPLTVTDDGQVYGHVAEWGVCHIGFDGVCVDPPRSPSNYARFCTGTTYLDNGERIGTGVLSIGGGHAGDRLSPRAAIAHYDSTSTAVADVVASDGEHGIWVCGRIRPGATDEMVTALLASDVSGDWRGFGGELDMVAVLACNVGGFKRSAVHVAASGTEVISLVAAGVVHRSPEEKAEAAMSPEDMAEFAEQVATIMEGRAARRAEMAALAERMSSVPILVKLGAGTESEE